MKPPSGSNKKGVKIQSKKPDDSPSADIVEGNGLLAERQGSQSVKSADRALALLEFVASEGFVNFTQILDVLSLPRSSAHGLLKTLIASSWLEQNPQSKQYSLGLRTWQVGQLYRGHSDLVGIAKPVMDRLARTVGETVQLARLDGIENVYIAISESDKEMRLASSVGGRLLAHATGIGKALLSMINPVEAETLLRSRPLPQYTNKTETDVDQLMALINEVRRVGFALDDEEYISGCRCVAVALTNDNNGGILTALSVSMPTSRTDQNWPESIVEPLKLAAREIRSILGIPESTVSQASK